MANNKRKTTLNVKKGNAIPKVENKAFKTMQNGEVKWGRAKKNKAQMENTGGIKAVQRKGWGRRGWTWNLEIGRTKGTQTTSRRPQLTLNSYTIAEEARQDRKVSHLRLLPTWHLLRRQLWLVCSCANCSIAAAIELIWEPSEPVCVCGLLRALLRLYYKLVIHDVWNVVQSDDDFDHSEEEKSVHPTWTCKGFLCSIFVMYITHTHVLNCIKQKQHSAFWFWYLQNFHCTVIESCKRVCFLSTVRGLGFSSVLSWNYIQYSCIWSLLPKIEYMCLSWSETEWELKLVWRALPQSDKTCVYNPLTANPAAYRKVETAALHVLLWQCKPGSSASRSFKHHWIKSNSRRFQVRAAWVKKTSGTNWMEKGGNLIPSVLHLVRDMM